MPRAAWPAETLVAAFGNADGRSIVGAEAAAAVAGADMGTEGAEGATEATAAVVGSEMGAEGAEVAEGAREVVALQKTI